MVVYRALYGEGGLWTRPTEMWNEPTTEDRKTYHHFYRLDRIERVEKYGRMFDEDIAKHIPEKLWLLDAYDTSDQWRENYEADESGGLPPDLKRELWVSQFRLMYPLVRRIWIT